MVPPQSPSPNPLPFAGTVNKRVPHRTRRAERESWEQEDEELQKRNTDRYDYSSRHRCTPYTSLSISIVFTIGKKDAVLTASEIG